MSEPTLAKTWGLKFDVEPKPPCFKCGRKCERLPGHVVGACCHDELRCARCIKLRAQA